MIRILHLSDIHFSKDSSEDFNNFLIRALLKDIKKNNDKNAINLVVISGDLIDKGGISYQGVYNALNIFKSDFIIPILKEIDITQDFVYFAPGNHDINRKADKDYAEAGLQSNLSSVEKLNSFIDDADNSDMKRVSEFKRFEKDFYNDYDGEKQLSLFESSFLTEIDKIQVGITAFNSSWRCYSDNDKDSLLLGERQITNSRKIIENAKLKIAIMHHPLDWLANFDKKNVAPMINRDFDLILFGHAHEPLVNNVTSLQGKLFHLQSPSNWTYNLRKTEKGIANGYMIVDYIPEKGKLQIHHRQYSHMKESYIPNVEFGNDLGIEEYTLPTRDDISKSVSEYKIANSIESLRFSELNEHLISFSTNSNAPKDIDSIFVEPRIFRKTKEIDGEKKEVLLELTELLQSEKNHLIFGTKESGKTVLLDHLLIKFTRDLQILHKFPVYFDFNELGNRRFETIISQYLNIPILETPKFLENHKVILLIDNVNFNSNNETNINRLTKFVLETECQIIATSFQFIEGEPPFDFINLRPQHLTIDYLHIKSFNATQIRKLISNWFCYDSKFETPGKSDKVLKILLALNLPRSPLTISMFLWIIEQQEGYRPQNKAIMLENFIEKILKKDAKNTIFSDKFDYINKVHLLSEISFEMYDVGNNNYSLGFNKLNNFVHERIKSKKFEFDSNDIITEFIKNGIFVKEHNGSENTIRFRFGCFFEYFLMKRMDFKKDFLKFVLKDYNYLNFSNELDYYTGIERNQENILQLIIDDMNVLYKDLLQIISKNSDSFDIIFSKSKDSLASRLDDNFINEINTAKDSVEEETLEIQEEILETMPLERELKLKPSTLSETQKLERIWTLAAKVLKNTEEIDSENLKSESFSSIVKCSLAFALLYKQHLVKIIINDKKESQPSNYELFLNDYLPLIHEMVLSNYIGTAKLNVVIKEHLDKIIGDNKVSNFEKYVVVFIYSDLLGKDYIQYIKKFVNNIKNGNLYDVTLFKLMSLYYFESKSEESDNIFENLIGDVITGAKGLPKIKKGEIMANYRKKKKHEKDKLV